MRQKRGKDMKRLIFTLLMVLGLGHLQAQTNSNGNNTEQASESMAQWHYAERFPPLPHMRTMMWFSMPSLIRQSWMQHPMMTVTLHSIYDEDEAQRSVVVHERIAVDSVKTKKALQNYKSKKQYEMVDNLQWARGLIVNDRWRAREKEIGDKR